MQKKYKEIQGQIKRKEQETKDCTFKPAINRKGFVDYDSKRKLQASPDIILVPQTGRVEDRLIERGLKTNEKKSIH